MLKRALLLTYYVPPRQASGSTRAGQLIGRLQQRGWELVSLVPDLRDDAVRPCSSVHVTGVTDFKAPFRRLLGVSANGTTHERLGIVRPMEQQAQSLAQRVLHAGHDLTEYANRIAGWTGPGSRAASDLLRRWHFDAVISTSPPEATHFVAARVHGHVPWLADFRDPWQRHGIGKRPTVLAALDRVLEPRVLRSAAALITVSEPLAQTLRERYPGKAVYSAPNAFSAEEWSDIPFSRPQRATLLYAGQFYAGRRDPRPLFEAVAQLLRVRALDEREFRVEIHGDDSEWLRSEIQSLGLDVIIGLHGRLPRGEILIRERAATRLLLLLSNDDEEEGTYTGKFFEYLGARRKIIAFGGPERSVVDEALEKTGAGRRYRDVAGLCGAIVEAVEAWRRGEDEVLAQDAVAPYEAETLADTFISILERWTSSI